MLLTNTTEMAIQCLVYLAREPEDTRITPAIISERFGSSVTYLSKVLRTLAQDGILNSERGRYGGFTLAVAPEDITLLQVVEACQGTIAGNYCKELTKKQTRNACAYHQAMAELQETVSATLEKWSIATLAELPLPTAKVAPDCRLRQLTTK